MHFSLQRHTLVSSLYLQGVNAGEPCLRVLVFNDDERPPILIKRKRPESGHLYRCAVTPDRSQSGEKR